MNALTCPNCRRVAMAAEEAERLLRKAASKTLLSHCACGEALEIRALGKDIFEVTTSSGTRQIDEKRM